MNTTLGNRLLTILTVLAGCSVILTTTVMPVVSAQATTNNSSDIEYPSHKEIERIESKETLNQLSSVLSRSVLERYSDSLNEINTSNYDQAEELLGGETARRLELYIDVSSDLGNEEQAETFSSTQSSQQKYTSDVSSFERTYQQYQQARNDGDYDRARQIARELVSDHSEALASSNNLKSSYKDIEQVTNYNTSQIRAIIERREVQLNKTREQVVSNELVRTKITLNSSSSSVSFTDSLQLTGQIETLSGQPLQNQDATISVQNQEYQVTLDNEGQFQRQIKPTNVWRNQSQGIQIQYIPEESAVYLGNQTTIPVTVTTTATEVSIVSERDEVSFDTPTAITGTVTTANTTRPVPNAPVGIRMGGIELGVTRTARDGQFEFDQPIPSTIPTGDTTVQTNVVASPLALQPTQRETVVAVETTPSKIEFDVEPKMTDSPQPAIQIRGQLTSADGRPIKRAPINIRINGTRQGVIRSTSTGEFGSEIPIPEDITAGDSLMVQGIYNGSETNLESSSTSTIVSNEALSTYFQQSTTSESTTSQVSTLIQVISITFVGVGIIISTAVWWSRRDQTTTSDPLTEQSQAVSSTSESDDEDTKQLVDIAQEKLDDGDHKSAATLAYMAVRQSFDASISVSQSTTHWEWYRACSDAGVKELSEIETLVQAFEQVQFAPGSEETSQAAHQAVTAAKAIFSCSTTTSQ